MAMEASDVVIMPTAMSLSHTDARKSACKKGARIVSLPGIEEKMLKKGGLSADYNEVKKISDRVAKMLTKAEQIEIKTKKGTEFEASLKGRKGWSDSGILRKGGFSNLPAGEGFIAPVEGKSNGKITFDGSFGELGVLKDPIKIWIEKGNVVHASHENLVHKLKECGADRIAEIGIGTNPKARIIGNVLEDEKVLGTVHIGLGDNHTFGGMIRSKTHWDGIVKKPTVLLDGKVIMEDGKFVACSIKR
jgi:leucyl aminopeptidase (aminopeptidase T)